MRLSHLIVMSMFVGSSLVACGGDDGGGGGGGVDAAPVVDAAPDAPPALTGLGAACVPSMQGADCPAPLGCLGNPSSTTANGFCTSVCQMNAAFMTDGDGAFTTITPDPAAMDATCAGMYTGTIGSASCSAPFGLTPAHNPLMPNTNYTISFACGVECGPGNTCPAGQTCNTQLMQCRPPA